MPSIQCLAYQPAVCSDRPTTVQLLVRLHPPERKRSRGRPALNVGLCIDRSGSMDGEPMDNARQAAIHLVQRLQSTDFVSVVSFDSMAEVQAPCRPVGSHEAIVQRLEQLEARGNTALHQGWLESCEQTSKGLDKRRLSRVILLSDGQANVGLTDRERISQQVAQWQTRGISTSTVGLGLGYNEDLLSAMASAGNGSFHHVASPADIESAFHLELQSMLAAHGRAVSLGIVCAPGVTLLRVYNPLEKTPRGRLKVADLIHGNPIDVVVELAVPALTFEQDLACLRLAWTSVDTGEREVLYHSFRLPVVPFGQLSEFPVCPEVLQKRALQISARVLRKAARRIERRDFGRAREALKAGLLALREAGPAPDLQDPIERMTRMLRSLESGSYGEVRKQATFASTSWSSGSVSLSPLGDAVGRWSKLPEHERTPERLQQILEENAPDGITSSGSW